MNLSQSLHGYILRILNKSTNFPDNESILTRFENVKQLLQDTEQLNSDALLKWKQSYSISDAVDVLQNAVNLNPFPQSCFALNSSNEDTNTNNCEFIEFTSFCLLSFAIVNLQFASEVQMDSSDANFFSTLSLLANVLVQSTPEKFTNEAEANGNDVNCEHEQCAYFVVLNLMYLVLRILSRIQRHFDRKVWRAPVCIADSCDVSVIQALTKGLCAAKANLPHFPFITSFPAILVQESGAKSQEPETNTSPESPIEAQTEGSAVDRIIREALCGPLRSALFTEFLRIAASWAPSQNDAESNTQITVQNEPSDRDACQDSVYAYTALHVVGISLFGRKEQRISITAEVDLNSLLCDTLVSILSKILNENGNQWETENGLHVMQEIGIVVVRLLRRSASRYLLEWPPILNVIQMYAPFRHTLAPSLFMPFVLELAAYHLHSSVADICESEYKYRCEDDNTSAGPLFLIPLEDVAELLELFRDVLPTQIAIALMDRRFEYAEPWRGLGHYCDSVSTIMKQYYVLDTRSEVKRCALDVVRNAMWTYFRIYDDTLLGEILLPALSEGGPLKDNPYALQLVCDIASDLSISDAHFTSLIELIDSINVVQPTKPPVLVISESSLQLSREDSHSLSKHQKHYDLHREGSETENEHAISTENANAESQQIHLLAARSLARVMMRYMLRPPGLRAVTAFRSLVSIHMHTQQSAKARLYILQWLGSFKVDMTRLGIEFELEKSQMQEATNTDDTLSQSYLVSSPFVLSYPMDPASQSLELIEKDDELAILPVQILLSQLLIRLRSEEDPEIIIATCRCLENYISQPHLVLRCDLRALLRAIYEDIQCSVESGGSGKNWTCTEQGLSYAISIISVLIGYGSERVGESETENAMLCISSCLLQSIRNRNWYLVSRLIHTVIVLSLRIESFTVTLFCRTILMEAMETGLQASLSCDDSLELGLILEFYAMPMMECLRLMSFNGILVLEGATEVASDSSASTHYFHSDSSPLKVIAAPPVLDTKPSLLETFPDVLCQMISECVSVKRFDAFQSKLNGILYALSWSLKAIRHFESSDHVQTSKPFSSRWHMLTMLTITGLSSSLVRLVGPDYGRRFLGFLVDHWIRKSGESSDTNSRRLVSEAVAEYLECFCVNQTEKGANVDLLRPYGDEFGNNRELDSSNTETWVILNHRSSLYVLASLKRLADGSFEVVQRRATGHSRFILAYSAISSNEVAFCILCAQRDYNHRANCALNMSGKRKREQLVDTTDSEMKSEAGGEKESHERSDSNVDPSEISGSKVSETGFSFMDERQSSDQDWPVPSLNLIGLGTGNENVRKIVPTENDALSRALSVLDRVSSEQLITVGLVYVSNSDEDEAAVLSHRAGSPLYLAFLSSLGYFSKLSRKTGSLIFSGGLDVSGRDIDGEFMLHWIDPGVQLVYHVTTMMPNNEKTGGARWKKRHIGNDQVTIVWINDGILDLPVDAVLPSQFNSVQIIVAPISDHFVRVVLRVNRLEHVFGRMLGPLVPEQIYVFSTDKLALVASLVRSAAINSYMACSRSTSLWHARHLQISRLAERAGVSNELG
eukprot:CAMPEP_0182451128 /NCGR_PEP_ID=MMETSP1172-20130603/43550_1 /TAXON_ID=708627 /ORGANISM="Timspurckia oligopyrenoides, Strain CCMP3278" /LENGTH=1565 /DNA_ID=CAMNT_0024648871 /DNA_START=149 /DNA_END=4846 /DNA_ORIENTATION=+